MNKKTRISIIAASLFLVLTIPIIAETAFAKPADIPKHVNLPPQAIDNAKIFDETIIQTDKIIAVFKPTVITTENPDDHQYTGSIGSGKLILERFDGTAGCTGVLIDRTHMLTAAHCVANSFGNNYLDGSKTSSASFNGGFQYAITDVVVHQKYNGNYIKGYDIAIVTLDQQVDSDIEVVHIDRNESDDIGEINVLGFGLRGTGLTGSVSGTFGIHTEGKNRVDDYADTMYQYLQMKPNKDYKRELILQSDFDSGLSDNDGFGKFFGNADLGTNIDTTTGDESSICSGDSGGGIYNSNDEVTGINSYIARLTDKNNGSTSDINGTFDCSFGEFAGHTRVSQYVDWIDSELGGAAETDGPNCNGKSKNPRCS